MSITRLQEIGTIGAAQKNAETQRRVDSIQSRNSGDTQIPRLSIFRQASQTLVDNIWEDIDFDFEEFDNNELHTGDEEADLLFSTDNSGIWVFMLSAEFDTNTTGSRRIRVLLNRNETISNSRNMEMATASSATGDSIIQSQFMFNCNEGDTVSIQVAQYSGGDLDLISASCQCFRLGV